MFTTYIVCCACPKQESVESSPILRAIDETPKAPPGWYEINTTGGYRAGHFCSPECARRWCDDEIEREERQRQRLEGIEAAATA